MTSAGGSRRVELYRRALSTVFGRTLTTRDGVAERRLQRAEARLHLALPPALRDYYALAGAAPENRQHNRLLPPEALVVEKSHLVFMEENQSVVDWGIRVATKMRSDPEVWQRVTEDEAEWYSEEMSFSTFILKNLAWQRGVELPAGVIPHAKPAPVKG